MSHKKVPKNWIGPKRGHLDGGFCVVVSDEFQGARGRIALIYFSQSFGKPCHVESIGTYPKVWTNINMRR